MADHHHSGRPLSPSRETGQPGTKVLLTVGLTGRLAGWGEWPSRMVVVRHTLGFWRSRSVRRGRVPAPGQPHRPAQETVLSTLATNLLLAASGDDGGMHIPSIAEFFPPVIAFEGTIFEINRITLVRLVSALAVSLLFWAAANRAQLVPGRAQNVAEMALDFVRVDIAEEVLGERRARPHVPLLTVMFFAIVAMNITGVVPLLNIASTSVVTVPLLLAVVAWIAFVVAGIRAHGAVGFVRLDTRDHERDPGDDGQQQRDRHHGSRSHVEQRDDTGDVHRNDREEHHREQRDVRSCAPLTQDLFGDVHPDEVERHLSHVLCPPGNQLSPSGGRSEEQADRERGD